MNQSTASPAVVGVPDGFTSQTVDVDGVSIHAVYGGPAHAPAVLLLPGWPQSWYAWRHIMPLLGQTFRVVAVDPRGFGHSDAPTSPYDTATVATELRNTMQTLGHRHFNLAGHDVGMWLAYALASDHPDAVNRLALIDAILPGLSPSPPLLLDRPGADRLWHFAFNRAAELPEVLVAGNERAFIEYQLALKTHRPGTFSPEDIDVYEAALQRPEILRGSFEHYRAIDSQIVQNQRRATSPLPMPTIGIGGDHSTASSPGELVSSLATDARTAVINDCGHYIPEEQPAQLADILVEFFTPPTHEPPTHP